jgi:hypothetical protein
LRPRRLSVFNYFVHMATFIAQKANAVCLKVFSPFLRWNANQKLFEGLLGECKPWLRMTLIDASKLFSRESGRVIWMLRFILVGA